MRLKLISASLIAIAVLVAVVGLIGLPTASAAGGRTLTLNYDTLTNRVVGEFSGVFGDAYVAAGTTRGVGADACWGNNAHRTPGVSGDGSYDASADPSGTQYTFTARFYNGAQTLVDTMNLVVVKP